MGRCCLMMSRTIGVIKAEKEQARLDYQLRHVVKTRPDAQQT